MGRRIKYIAVELGVDGRFKGQLFVTLIDTNERAINFLRKKYDKALGEWKGELVIKHTKLLVMIPFEFLDDVINNMDEIKKMLVLIKEKLEKEDISRYL